MRIIGITLKFSALAVFAVALHAPARADFPSQRAWVSGTGNDSNTCTRTSPCKTWAGALAKTLQGGLITALSPGDFGSVTINKSVILDGGGEFAGTGEVTIDIGLGETPSSTTLRNMSIRGPGFGVRVLRATSVFIENVQIHDIPIGVGVEVDAAEEVSLTMDGVRIRNCLTGVRTQTSAGYVFASLNDVGVQKCTVGLEAAARSRVGVRDSVFTRNPTGLKTAGNSSIVNVESSLVSFSQTVGLIASAGSTIRLASSNVTQNSTGVKANGGQVVSLGGNSVFGNTINGAFNSTQPKT
jgi:hypothetical protein